MLATSYVTTQQPGPALNCIKELRQLSEGEQVMIVLQAWPGCKSMPGYIIAPLHLRCGTWRLLLMLQLDRCCHVQSMVR